MKKPPRNSNRKLWEGQGEGAKRALAPRPEPARSRREARTQPENGGQSAQRREASNRDPCFFAGHAYAPSSDCEALG